MSERRVLRPLDYGEIFNEAFDLYKQNFLLFFGIGAVVYLPYGLLSGLLSGSNLTEGLLTLGSLLPIFAAYGAVVKALADRYLGEPVTIGGAWRYLLQRLLPYMLTWLIVLFLMSLVLAAFVLAVVYASENRGMASAVLIILLAVVLVLFASLWLAFLPSVMIVEDRFYRDAVRRSGQLAAGNWWRIFVVSFFTGLVTYGAMIVVVVIFSLFTGLGTVLVGQTGGAAASPETWGAMAAMQILYGVLQAILTPVTALAFVLLYFDVRVRREGYDVELLAREMADSPARDP
jgi:hypothetical protein